MKTIDNLVNDPAAQELFMSRLPWYINGSLDNHERSWVDTQLATSTWARETLELENMLVASSITTPPPQGDLGLHRLLRKVSGEREQQQTSQARVKKPELVNRLAASISEFFAFAARPQVAFAAWALVLMQAGWIGFNHLSADREDELTRSGHSLVRHSLRVTFVGDVDEAKLRGALVAAGARIIAGPNQFGEYWLWSQVNSLDEMKRSLEESGIVASMVADDSPP